MATKIEEIELAAYTAIEAIPEADRTIVPKIPFLRHRLRETPLDGLPLPDRIRAFTVQLGPGTFSETWSSRSRRWFSGELWVRVGYISSDEAARDPDLTALGYEGMADADLTLIVNQLLYGAFAAIGDMHSPEYLRSDPTAGTSRLHVLSITWAEVVSA